MHQVLLILPLSFVHLCVFPPLHFIAIPSNSITIKCDLLECRHFLAHAAIKVNSLNTTFRDVIPSLLQCLALKFPHILALIRLHTIWICSVLFSLSHLGRTVSDYKMAFQNVWGWGRQERRQASRENITLKYTEIINHNPTSVMLRYEKCAPYNHNNMRDLLNPNWSMVALNVNTICTQSLNQYFPSPYQLINACIAL